MKCLRFGTPVLRTICSTSFNCQKFTSSNYHTYTRQAKNAPIQGTNAGIIKYALVILYNTLPHDAKVITCVHDELIVEVPSDRSDK